MIACACNGPRLQAQPSARGKQERLTADRQHHARIAARHAAETHVELAPAPVVGREAEARHRLHLVLGHDPLRSR